MNRQLARLIYTSEKLGFVACVGVLICMTVATDGRAQVPIFSPIQSQAPTPAVRAPTLEELFAPPRSPYDPDLFIGVGAGFGHSNTGFNVSPPFNVRSTGGVINVDGGFLIPVVGSPFPAAIGPEVNFVTSLRSGSTNNPAASPFFSYTVEPRSIASAGTRLKLVFSSFSPTVDIRKATSSPALYISGGIASVKTNVIGTTPGFTVSSSTTRTGPYAAVGLLFPFTTAIEFQAELRGIFPSSGSVQIPGNVYVQPNIYTATAGFNFNFAWPIAPPPPPAPPR